MKNYCLALCLLFSVAMLLPGCSKNEPIIEEDTIYWGEATALKNNEAWSGKTRCFMDPLRADTFSISLYKFNSVGLKINVLGFNGVPFNTGKYRLDSDNSSEGSTVESHFSITEHDILKASYDISPNDEGNFIEIEVNEETGEVNGTFNCFFVNYPEITRTGAELDTVIFTNGVIRTTIYE